ncbi:MAG: D-glycerate dehydrogenase [Candidatus Thermoplasmatota archaeon]|nr:D-glycerate dehydrogenase [Candidatus Thermoplasmatota archaeon]
MKIFVTRNIPEKGIRMLEEQYEVEINPYNRVLTKTEILKGVKGKDGLLCLLTDHIDKDLITAEPRLKMIANYAVGYNNIDVQTATIQGIPVSNTPDVLTDTTAEMAWALVFAVSRRLIEGDTFTRSGKFDGWAPMLLLGQDISRKTLGVIGAGRIGTAFALKSKGFDMNVLYVDEKRNKDLERHLHAKNVSLEQCLQESDVISVHVPLNSKTHHLIGEKELKMMKKTALFINTSRGPVVDEDALIHALQNKWIYGAGLDVYEHEPSIPIKLLRLENVVLQPHTASATTETRTNMAIMAAENMIAGLNGGIPPNCVNPEVFKKAI